MSAAFDNSDVTARQVTPLTVAAIAAWCGGAVSVDAAGNQGVDLPGGARAGYGAWVTTPADADAGGLFDVVGPVEFRRTYLEQARGTQ